MSLSYVTTNKGKYLRVKELALKNNIEIDEYSIDIEKKWDKYKYRRFT